MEGCGDGDILWACTRMPILPPYRNKGGGTCNGRGYSMKVTVCRLYKNGILDQSIQESIPGDLGLGRYRHHVLNREVSTLMLLAPDGSPRHAIEPLIDAFCYCIGADGMFWRGFEVGPKGRQQAQEWFVRPVCSPDGERHGS